MARRAAEGEGMILFLLCITSGSFILGARVKTAWAMRQGFLAGYELGVDTGFNLGTEAKYKISKSLDTNSDSWRYVVAYVNKPLKEFDKLRDEE